MNMLDVEDDSFPVTHEGYSHLSKSELEVVGRMSVLMGEPAISGMLKAPSRDQQHAAINKFLQGELAVERQKIALLQQQGSHQSMGGLTHTHRPETLKIGISKYKGTDEDSLLRWFVELDDAIRAHHIECDEMQVTLALSNLTRRAKTWALGLKFHDPNVFESLEILKSRLKDTFEPPRAEFRAGSALLRLSKTYMFQEDFHTLEKAIAYAEQEDFSLRQSQANSSNYRPTRRQETVGPEPIDLCYVESENSRSTSQANGKMPSLSEDWTLRS
uniref:Retrotransposon gag domain-containing protein n=1 Tax=Peronospora matthiolae TaxID=2874970 RepID=A0AAV1VMB0_9STRA